VPALKHGRVAASGWWSSQLTRRWREPDSNFKFRAKWATSLPAPRRAAARAERCEKSHGLQCGVSADWRNAPTVPGSSHDPVPVQPGPTPAASPAARAEQRLGARPEPSRCRRHAHSEFGPRASVERAVDRRVLVDDDWRSCRPPSATCSRWAVAYPPPRFAPRHPSPRRGRPHYC
jgi:hypothetical protein